MLSIIHTALKNSIALTKIMTRYAKERQDSIGTLLTADERHFSIKAFCNE